MGHVLAAAATVDGHLAVEIGTQRVERRRVVVAGAVDRDGRQRRDGHRAGEVPVDVDLQRRADAGEYERVVLGVVAAVPARIVGIDHQGRHQACAANERGEVLAGHASRVPHVDRVRAGRWRRDQHLLHIVHVIGRVLDRARGGVCRVQRPGVVGPAGPGDPDIQIVDQHGSRFVESRPVGRTGRVRPDDRRLDRLRPGGSDFLRHFLSRVARLEKRLGRRARSRTREERGRVRRVHQPPTVGIVGPHVPRIERRMDQQALGRGAARCKLECVLKMLDQKYSRPRNVRRGHRCAGTGAVVVVRASPR